MGYRLLLLYGIIGMQSLQTNSYILSVFLTRFILQFWAEKCSKCKKNFNQTQNCFLKVLPYQSPQQVFSLFIEPWKKYNKCVTGSDCKINLSKIYTFLKNAQSCCSNISHKWVNKYVSSWKLYYTFFKSMTCLMYKELQHAS